MTNYKRQVFKFFKHVKVYINKQQRFLKLEHFLLQLTQLIIA